MTSISKMSLEHGKDSIIVRDSGAVWCDGAIIMNDGTLIEHRFRNRSLVSILRRKIRVEREDVSEDFVSVREISLFVTGRCRRRAAGLSIYWHTNSDIIYILTGVSYCAQIYIECGRSLPNGDMEMFSIPRVFLVRARSPHTGITQISWSRTPGIWPKDVVITLDKLAANTPGARPPVVVSPSVGTVGFPRVVLAGDMYDLSYVPIVVGDQSLLSGSCFENKLKLDCETSFFLERASSVHRQLLTIDRELETSVGRRREVFMMCNDLAARKRLMLVDGTAVVNLFVAQICLYGLGEDNVAQDIVGVLHRRKDKGDAVFNLHNVALANAMQLALMMRRIQQYPGHLPLPDERLDASDHTVSAVQEFYANDMDVGMAVISMAVSILRAFSSRGSVSDAVAATNGCVPLTGCVERADVIKILKL